MSTRKDNVLRGVSITIVILIGIFGLVLGWTAHHGLSQYYQRNVTGVGMFFELYRVFKDPAAFISFIGSSILIIVKVWWTLKNKRQGERKR